MDDGKNLNFRPEMNHDIILDLLNVTVTALQCQSESLYLEEVFVQRLYESVSLWWTFGGGTRLDVGSK